MTTVINESTNHAATSPAQRLRGTMAAVRVSIRWFGTRKSLTVEQKAEAAAQREPQDRAARCLLADAKRKHQTAQEDKAAAP